MRDHKYIIFISIALILALIFLRRSTSSLRQDLTVRARANAPTVARDSVKKAISLVTQRLSTPHSQNPLLPLADITENDFPALEQTVLNPQMREEDRSAALYLLTQATPLPVHALGEIMRAPLPVFQNSEDPHSAGSLHRSIEVAFRVRALEALDQRSKESPDVARELEKEMASEELPSLRLLAQISLMGIQQGKPGKAGRFIDLALRGGDGR